MFKEYVGIFNLRYRKRRRREKTREGLGEKGIEGMGHYRPSDS
jgi:hypothetical protein